MKSPCSFFYSLDLLFHVWAFHSLECKFIWKTKDDVDYTEISPTADDLGLGFG